MKLRLIAALFAVVFISGVASIAFGSHAGSASAAPGDVTVTVTHWTTNATGAVSGTTGGAVGAGTVTGQYLAYSAGPPTTATVSLQLNGAAHQMTITISTNDAAVTGTVADGWLKGQSFTGSYTGQVACSQSNDGNCYTFAFIVNDPASVGTGGTTTTPPAVGTGLAPQHESAPFLPLGLALTAVGALGVAATTLRTRRR